MSKRRGTVSPARDGRRLPRNRSDPRRKQAARPRRNPLSILGRTSVLVVASIALVSGIVAYAVLQTADSGTPGPSPSARAALDANPNLPGQYVRPHPGPDGKPGTSDDGQHLGVGVSLPICSPDVLAADSLITDPTADRTAVANCYTSNPPTSGPMSGQTGGFRIYQNPVPKEALLHTMEHAGVVVWYNTDNDAIKKQLESVVKDQQDRRRLVAMVPYPEMEPDTIALTAWTRLDKFSVDDFSRKRVEEFVAAHNKRYNPEGF